MSFEPISFDGLLDVFRREVDKAYAVGLENENDGFGFDIVRAYARQLARVAEGFAVSSQAYYLLPHSTQVRPEAQGEARALAERGCVVTGLDPSPEMLAEARAAAPGIVWVEGRAEAIGLAEGAFDWVTAATCWHWFDRAAAAREARRVLAPGGRLLVCSLDWHRVPGGVVDATMAVLRRFSPVPEGAPQGGGVFQYPAWARELLAAGFTGWESFALTLPLAYSPAAWRGRVQASAGVVAMAPEVRRAFDAALAEVLPAGEGMAVEHHLFALAAW